MNKTTSNTLAHDSSSQQAKARQRLYQWALTELQAKGYSNKIINTAILRALKDFQGRKLAFINWVLNTPSYRQNSQFDPQKQSSFIINQAAPAMASLLRKKGYVDEAVDQLVGLMISHAGDTGHCSIAGLWQSAKDWPVVR
ncbi:hypothetical protein [Endozoicomonas lisbonensis]|uniref:Uncharacterized protein n=1 Tax=Endozoicomonas lisbonensis TaxID=3120522 RepID=A0ABV2SHE0_9GAMM